jgi:hypothetical protein
MAGSRRQNWRYDRVALARRHHVTRGAALLLLFAFTALSAASSARADPTPRDQVLRPADRSINERGERQTNMEAVEAARDRGAWRIVDEDTWTLDRMEAYRDTRYVPGRDFQLLDQERDRTLRVDKRDANRSRAKVRSRQPLDPAGEVDLGIVPEDITRPGAGGGISPLAAQVYEDERTLENADAGLARMLKQLNEAETRELQSLRGRLDKEGRAPEFDARAAKVHADYEKWRNQARAARQAERARVLGTKPATRPAGKTVSPPK